MDVVWGWFRGGLVQSTKICQVEFQIKKGNDTSGPFF